MALEREEFERRIDEVQRLCRWALFHQEHTDWRRIAMQASYRALGGDGEDLIQEIIVYFLERLDRKPIEAGFSTAMVKGARWKTLALRKIQRAKVLAEPERYQTLLRATTYENAELQEYRRDDELRERVAEVLKSMNYRERKILEFRYGLDDSGYSYTLEETGRILKKTKERIRQIESKALRKLQHHGRAKYLATYAVDVEGMECVHASLADDPDLYEWPEVFNVMIVGSNITWHVTTSGSPGHTGQAAATGQIKGQLVKGIYWDEATNTGIPLPQSVYDNGVVEIRNKKGDLTGRHIVTARGVCYWKPGTEFPDEASMRLRPLRPLPELDEESEVISAI